MRWISKYLCFDMHPEQPNSSLITNSILSQLANNLINFINDLEWQTKKILKCKRFISYIDINASKYLFLSLSDSKSAPRSAILLSRTMLSVGCFTYGQLTRDLMHPRKLCCWYSDDTICSGKVKFACWIWVDSYW